VREEKIVVIHSGTNDPAASSSASHSESDRFRIGIVGQLNPWKGHLDLLEGFGLLTHRHPDVELHIFGKGDEAFRGDLCRRSTELGVAERVVWHGYVADRAAIYQNLDVCVVPTRSSEPLGLAAIEPGFFGLPAVVSKRGGLPEIIEHEVNGLLVEAERPVEIMQALSRLIEEPELRARLGSNARKRALEYFGIERFLDDFTALLATENSVRRQVIAASV
jgi:glycosyltransferase involved in cell wall biosynthesis